MAYKVGLRRLFYQDANRSKWDGTNPRPLLTDVWYPAVDTAVEVDVSIGPPNTPFFNAGKAARDAELVFAPASFPLVLLSHGTGGMSLQLGWLASYLASEGYIVAGINHHGNNALEPYTPQGFLHYWERAKDLTTVLNLLLVDSNVGPRINPDQVGAAGFSLGGYTAIAIAGGVTNIRLLIEAFQNSGRDLSKEIPEFPDPAALMEEFNSLDRYTPVADASYRDYRVKSILAIAPALGEAFSPEGLSPIRIPVRIIVGEADQIAPAAANASYFAKHIKGAELTILEKVGHYTFLAEATEAGKRGLPTFCLDAPGVSRVSTHRMVGRWAKEFFENDLKIK
jgi:predicted dienelactone hydrolase